MREINGYAPRRGRGSNRGFRGCGNRASGDFRGGMGSNKPPPLMARPLPPPSLMRQELHGPGGPRGFHPRPLMPLMDDYGMRPPMPPPPRGGPNMRYRPPPMRGMRPPPPHLMHGHPGMYPPRPPMPLMPGLPMRGRGMRGREFMSIGMGLYRGAGRGRGVRGRGSRGKSSLSTSPSREINKPWVTESMKNEILKKHKLHQKAKKGHTQEDWDVFKEHRNMVTTMLRDAKLEYENEQTQATSQDKDTDNKLAEATTSSPSASTPPKSPSKDMQELMEEELGGPIDPPEPPEELLLDSKKEAKIP